MVVKLNKADHFPEMFEKEALGLKKLSVANALRIPEVFAYGTIQKEAYLLLEYLSTSSKKENFWLNVLSLHHAKLYFHHLLLLISYKLKISIINAKSNIKPLQM